MSVDVAAIVERARLSAQTARPGEAPGADREQLKRVAAEFESMLLLQMLRDMRRAGSWEDEGGGEALGGMESLFETLDVELASHLARVKGMGLSQQLEAAFDRLQGEEASSYGVLAHPAPAAATPMMRAYAAASAAAAPAGAPAAPHDVAHLAPDAVVSAVRTVAGAAASVPSAVAGAVRPVVEATAAAPAAVARLVRPVAGAVTSAFGWRTHPISGEKKFHQGVDLRAAYGQEVQAAAAGRVVFSGDQGGYGTTVMVQHADGSKTRYAHLSARLVQKGDQVAAGEPLGRAGRSGRATGTHLHFEVIAPDGRRVQPDQWGKGQTRVLADAAHTHEVPGRGAAPQRAAVGNPAGMTAGRSIQDSGPGAD